MSLERREVTLFIFCLLIVAGIILMSVSSPQAVIIPPAENWAAIPPYNLLWPLWSPILSPADPTTGIATPLLSELTNATILPVQPILFWNPAKAYAYSLYNIPSQFGGGLTAFDPYYGLNPWPPSSLVDPTTGAPVPIGLPLGYQFLPQLGISTSYTWGNILFNQQYPSVPLADLLTPADIWGLPVW